MPLAFAAIRSVPRLRYGPDGRIGPPRPLFVDGYEDELQIDLAEALATDAGDTDG